MTSRYKRVLEKREREIVARIVDERFINGG
jgi:hypothetical protein